MLRNVIKLLTRPIKAKNNGVSLVKMPHKDHAKPLVMRTVYSSQQNIGQGPGELLTKQQFFLENQTQLSIAAIEPCLLSKDAYVIGLTRHRKTILQGIFMYPETIQREPGWHHLESQACRETTGIALFRLKEDTHCLKVWLSNEILLLSYLVNYRAITRVKWLLHPSQPNNYSV